MSKDNVELAVRAHMLRTVSPGIVYTESSLYQTMLLTRPNSFISLDGWEKVLAKVLHDASNAEDRNDMDATFWNFNSIDRNGNKQEFFLLNPDSGDWNIYRPVSKR